MQAFEKKFPDLPVEVIRIGASHAVSSFYVKQIARKEGWQAALKWAFTQKIQSTEEILIDKEAIEKELENEDDKTETE